MLKYKPSLEHDDLSSSAPPPAAEASELEYKIVVNETIEMLKAKQKVRKR